MKKIFLAFPALVAAAIAVSGCAKQADDGNVVVTNEIVSNDIDSADGNFTAGTDSSDQNALDSNLADASGNAL